jgi:hypothetical protein
MFSSRLHSNLHYWWKQSTSPDTIYDYQFVSCQVKVKLKDVNFLNTCPVRCSCSRVLLLAHKSRVGRSPSARITAKASIGLGRKKCQKKIRFPNKIGGVVPGSSLPGATPSLGSASGHQGLSTVFLLLKRLFFTTVLKQASETGTRNSRSGSSC